nr:MAG TPA: hypothetical protein [Bacteriophage sp.]DAQ71964.1 MAG TPA: hypothetical protein [Caudoviricetes sp.]
MQTKRNPKTFLLHKEWVNVLLVQIQLIRDRVIAELV